MSELGSALLRSMLLYSDYLIPYVSFYGLLVASLQAADARLCTNFTSIDDTVGGGTHCVGAATFSIIVVGTVLYTIFFFVEVVPLPRAPTLTFNLVSLVEQHKESNLVRWVNRLKVACGVIGIGYFMVVNSLVGWTGLGMLTFLYACVTFLYAFHSLSSYEGLLWPGMQLPPGDDVALTGKFWTKTSTYLMSEIQKIASLDPQYFAAIASFAESPQGAHIDLAVAHCVGDRQYRLLRQLFAMEPGWKQGAVAPPTPAPSSGGPEAPKALLA